MQRKQPSEEEEREKEKQYWEGIVKKGTINVTEQKNSLRYRVCSMSVILVYMVTK